MIGLTDAFNFPDFALKSPIGKYDGQIYEGKSFNTMSTQTNHTFWVTAYFDTVLQAPNSMRKTPYHEKYIKPLTSRVAPN